MAGFCHFVQPVCGDGIHALVRTEYDSWKKYDFMFMKVSWGEVKSVSQGSDLMITHCNLLSFSQHKV